MNRKEQTGLGLLLAAAASLGITRGAGGGMAPIRKLLKEGLDPNHKDSPPCPRCGHRRTWKIGDRWRCRNDGVYFDVAPPAPLEPETVAPIVSVERVASVDDIKKIRAPRKKKESAPV